MDLVIDGVIYRFQTHGGISRIFDNILPILCELDPGLRVRIFNHWDLAKTPPQHKHITRLKLNKWDRYIRPWQLWRRTYPAIHNFFLQISLGKTKGKIWLSTYYSTPPFEWNGCQIVLVNDLIHEILPSLFPDSARTLGQKREAIKKADAVICISQTTAQDLTKYYSVPDSKIFVVRIGYDKIFRTRLVTKIDKMFDSPFILYVGKRNYYKGFDTLMNSFSQWARKREIKLVVIGSSWSPAEVDLINKIDLNDHIVLLKGIDDNQLCDLYNQAEAFIYPSLYEGFGIPLLEAMACGCPIVASQIPSTLEVAKDIPFYFEPSDTTGLISALNQAVDAGRPSEKIQKGLSIVNQYSWEQTASQVLDVLRTVSDIN